ncbi:uncharacterized protein LOC143196878 isoform X3 [Rhynchophorus ferrugineus]|uniref:uncharacterized protein LOC143196878 isoform X3 n=1 Tax=Rhynchophorus ferrugineus TaxID=354439 RepID=UPI003FCD1B34
MSKWKDNGVIVIVIVSAIIFSAIVFIYSIDITGNKDCCYHEICPTIVDTCYVNISSYYTNGVVLCAYLYNNKYLIDGILNNGTSLQKNETECDIQQNDHDCYYGYCTKSCEDRTFFDNPQNIPGNVTSLCLQNKNISILTNQSLSNYNLNMLFLGMNTISHIEPNTFKQQEYLSVLFLLRNRLTTLESGVFNGLRNLRWLHLNYNSLSRINLAEFTTLIEIKWLDLSNNDIEYYGTGKFPYLPSLLELFLNNNRITIIKNYTFSNLMNLNLLNLRYNNIKEIEEGSFTYLGKLRQLDLYGNQIIVLDANLFSNQRHLINMFLGKNPLENIQNSLFKNMHQLQILNLEDVEIPNINNAMFENLLNLEIVYFMYYRYCRFIPWVTICKPPSDGISSNDRLLFKPIFRYSNWIMCFFSLTGNTLVLFSRHLFRDKNKTLSIALKNLAVSDGLMGIYLIIIGYHDLIFRDNYNSIHLEWVSSWRCTLTGMLAMISQEVTVLLLVFMSLDRLFVITSSLKKDRILNVKDTWKVIFSIWCFGIILSATPVIALLSTTRFYGVNSLCLPLFIDDPYFIGWEYSAIIFFGINAPSLIIIIICYCIMFKSIKTTRNNTSMPLKSSEFAVRFFLIILTNIMCWLPIIIAKIVVYFEVEITDHVYGWLAVFILPINSSLNPILYTFTTRKYRRRLLNVPAFLKTIKTKESNMKEIFYIKMKK